MSNLFPKKITVHWYDADCLVYAEVLFPGEKNKVFGH